MGNVSYAVPTIQPFLSISDEEVPGHSEAFVEAAKSEKGLDSIRIAATLLALTGLDLLTQTETLQAIKEEHRQAVEELQELK